MAKAGSNATPSSPRSPTESTVTVTKGVESSVPFLMTRSFPACSQTKIRPSGAMAKAVGLARVAADLRIRETARKRDGRGRGTAASKKRANGDHPAKHAPEVPASSRPWKRVVMTVS